MTPAQKASLDAILKGLPPKRTASDNSTKALIKRLAWARVKESTPALWYEEDRIKRDFRFNSERYGYEAARQMLQEMAGKAEKQENLL